MVVFEGTPDLLKKWYIECSKIKNDKPGLFGDQDILFSLIKRFFGINVHELPHEYNTLRLDFIDNTAPPNPKIIHWTGFKGKEKIKKWLK